MRLSLLYLFICSSFDNHIIEQIASCSSLWMSRSTNIPSGTINQKRINKYFCSEIMKKRGLARVFDCNEIRWHLLDWLRVDRSSFWSSEKAWDCQVNTQNKRCNLGDSCSGQFRSKQFNESPRINIATRLFTEQKNNNRIDILALGVYQPRLIRRDCDKALFGRKRDNDRRHSIAGPFDEQNSAMNHTDTHFGSNWK